MKQEVKAPSTSPVAAGKVPKRKESDYRLRNQAHRNKGHKDPIDKKKDDNGKA